MRCHDEVPLLGKVAEQRTICCKEGICLCTREGRCTRLMMGKLNEAVKAAIPATELKTFLAGSLCGLLLEGSNGVAEIATAHGTSQLSGSRGANPQVFLHVAMHSLTPFRPTYLRMRRIALENGKAQCSAEGIWETQAPALSALDKTLQWSVKVFRLVSTLEPVASFEPHMQAYTMDQSKRSHSCFWRGAADELKAQRVKWPSLPAGPSEDAGADDDAAEPLEDGPGMGQEIEALSENGSDEASSGGFDYFFFHSGDEECGHPIEHGEADDERHIATPGGRHVSASGAAGSSSDPVQTPKGKARPKEPAKRSRGGGRDRSDILYYSVPGGEIRFYPATRRFVAHCEEAKHGQCRREKLPHGGAYAPQGRPLGYLVAWLLDNDYPSHAEHLASTAVIPLEARQAGRDALKAAIGADSPLFAHERCRREGEPEEPVQCP